MVKRNELDQVKKKNVFLVTSMLSEYTKQPPPVVRRLTGVNRLKWAYAQ